MSDYTPDTQFIDLKAQQEEMKSSLYGAIHRVLDHGKYIMGPEVAMLETELQEFSGVSHVLTCANGTDALTLVLMAWNIGPGDAVFVPSFTYVASAETVAQIGATPFFVDVCPLTFNIDSRSLEQAIIDCRELDLQPKAVIAVDLFGQICAAEEVQRIASENELKVIFDAAQSFGAERRGVRAGNFGDATTTSFFPAKPLGCYGDGGAVLTHDEQLAQTINSIRLHGRGAEKYDNVRVGINSRLDTLQAAILLEKLKLFPKEIINRNRAASTYDSLIKTPLVTTPHVDPLNVSVWAQYTLKSDYRDRIRRELTQNKIPTAIYYPIPLAAQKGYLDYPSVSSGLEVSSHLSKIVFSLPMHPYLTELEQINIANILNNCGEL